MTRPGIFGVTVQIWRKEGGSPMSDGNRNAGREALPAGPERPSITSPAELAVHLGRELSASAVDDNGWTDLHYAAALDWPAVARVLLGAGARLDARLRADVGDRQEVIISRHSSTDLVDDDAVAGRRHGRGRCGVGVCAAAG